MKSKIHPQYQDTVITCACGNKIETGSTKEDIHVEICSACHPFYTGKQKLIDTARRVEKYQEKMKKAKAMKTSSSKKKTEKKASPKSTQKTLHSNRLDSK